ncbi:hypothetical protein BCR43DRAFT_481997 [Syncephalastrum racemosum]|uniref:CHY-type domain-containing protein n=1 Tax=Syncephalastrum racemosum TaxID=13706 RepID=A0A1X2HSY6_SYNRA|nr:hypothetical protein BCR43DRAFT_481997 [Syncephalastrum racemosum]
MADSKRPIVKPQAKPSRAGGRQVELSQLERRYRSTFRTVKNTESATVVRLAFEPSDPDFPYDLDKLQLQLTVPARYPSEPCVIHVMNTNIPKGFAYNLEKGYENHIKQLEHPVTLVRQMAWLDKNLETLLQQEPAETIRFVAPQKQPSDVAPALPHEFVASVRETNDKGKAPSSSNRQELPQNDSGSKSKAKSNSKPKPKKEGPKLDASATPFFTSTQLKEARVIRDKELYQLQCRFRDSYKMHRNEGNLTPIMLTLDLNDPHFKYQHLFGGQLRIRYKVPMQYPLLPPILTVESKTLEKEITDNIAAYFTEHAKTSQLTLFQHLNWLNRNLEFAIERPPETARASTPPPEQKESKGALKKPAQGVKQQEDKRSVPTTSLFADDNDDESRRRVIIVQDPSMFRIPGVDADVSTSSASSAEESEDEHDIAPPPDAAHPSSADKSETALSSAAESSAPQMKRGTQIRFTQPRLDNISLFRCVALNMMVKCSRCRHTVDLEKVEVEDPLSKKEEKQRWMACPTCSTPLGMRFVGELMHENATTLGLLQARNCVPFDILPSQFLGTCARCMEDIQSPVLLAPHDAPRTLSCFGCHAHMTVALGEYSLVNIGQPGESLMPDEAQLSKAVLKKKKKRDEMILKVGEPLPNQGICSHYRKSKRWFRFPCCSKLYACDICHDSHEDHHPSELARRHVCGLCSREQPIKPECICGNEFDRSHQKGAFWEGGQGVRNKTLMSRKDAHKHRGLGKTGSKKQERVGLVGKEKRNQRDQ